MADTTTVIARYLAIGGAQPVQYIGNDDDPFLIEAVDTDGA